MKTKNTTKFVSCGLITVCSMLLIFSLSVCAIEGPYVYTKLETDDIRAYSSGATGTYKLFALRVGTHSERDVCINVQCSVGYGWLTNKSVYVAPGHSIDNQVTNVLSEVVIWRLYLHPRAFIKGGSATGYLWYSN